MAILVQLYFHISGLLPPPKFAVDIFEAQSGVAPVPSLYFLYQCQTDSPGGAGLTTAAAAAAAEVAILGCSAVIQQVGPGFDGSSAVVVVSLLAVVVVVVVAVVVVAVAEGDVAPSGAVLVVCFPAGCTGRAAAAGQH